MLLPIRRVLILVFLTVWLTTGICVMAQDDNEKVKILPPSSEWHQAVLEALAGCTPDTDHVHEGMNSNHCYILNGDVWHDGHSWAIIDHDPILVGEWKENHWVLDSAISATPEWLNGGEDSEGRKPQADKPFWLIPFKDNVILVIASEMDKYGQNYQLVLLDKDFRQILDTISSYGAQPILKDGFIFTEDASRNKATWGGEYYWQVQNEKFELVKSWMENSPYNQPDPSEFDGEAYCFEAKSGTNEYTITPDYRKLGYADAYLIFKGLLHLDGWKAIVNAWKTNKVYSTLSFYPNGKNQLASEDMPEGEMSYLFEKLTGLPRTLYDYPEGAQPKTNIEVMATIKVTGNPKARALLSPNNIR